MQTAVRPLVRQTQVNHSTRSVLVERTSRKRWNMTGKLLIFTSVSLRAPTVALADAVLQAHRCDNCSSASHMEGVAVQHGVGERYVYGLRSADARKFRVDFQCGGKTEPSRS